MTSDSNSLPMNHHHLSHSRNASLDGTGPHSRRGTGEEILFDTFAFPEEREGHGGGLEQLDEEDYESEEESRLVRNREKVELSRA